MDHIINLTSLEHEINTLREQMKFPFTALNITLRIDGGEIDNVSIWWVYPDTFEETIAIKSDIDLRELYSEFHNMFMRKNIPIKFLALTFSLPSNMFDQIVHNHPDKLDENHLRKIGKSTGQLVWSVQILRKHDPIDFQS